MTRSPATITTPTPFVTRYKRTVAAVAIGSVLLSSAPLLSAAESWSYTYNGNGQVLTADGPRTDVSDVITNTYDTAGNLATITNALGHVTQLQDYNGRGQPGKIIDPNGVVTELTYHARGWLLTSTVKDPSGNSAQDATTTYGYDNVGQVTSITLPDGSVINYEYDGAHRLVAISNALGERMEYTLDNAGNRTLEVIKDSGGTLVKTQTRIYDELSRLLQIVGADNQTLSYSYDPNGNVAVVTDGKLKDTSNAYDALDRLISETDPDSYSVGYTYDSQDRIKTVTDQRGLVTTYNYNGLDYLLSIASPDTGTTTYTHDEAGNRMSATDARGVITNYSYDALNRLTSVTYPVNPSENITYTYDDTANGNYGLGRLTGITDESGTTGFSYDHRGNLISKTYSIDGTGYSLDYSHDLSNNLTQITYPSGRLVNYTRDNQGRVTSITTQENAGASAETVINNVTYLPFGPVNSYTYGNGMVHTLSYDQDYRITDNQAQGTNAVLDLDYAYDANDNIDSIGDGDEPGNDQSFQYDNVDRLSQADGNYGTIDYQYDGVGNRTQRTINEGGNTTTETYTYDTNSNQLDQVATDDGTTQTQRTFQYDNNGNLIKDTKADGTVDDHIYNEANRRVELNRDTSLRATYLYNALGQRTAKTAIGDSTISNHYHYDEAGQLLAVTTDTGIAKRETIYLGTIKVAALIDDAYLTEWDAFDSGSSGGGGGNPDTDGDGIADAWELQYFASLTIVNGTSDHDGDGITDLEEYQNGTDPTVDDAPTWQTFSTRIDSTRDDVEEKADGQVKTSSVDLEMVQESTLQTIGLRFNNLTLPTGATITSATLQFTAHEVTSDTTNLVIEGQATGNATTFATTHHDVSSRPRTLASVAWNPAPWTTVGEAGSNQKTADLSAIVQEIVNRGDWSDGNSLAFIITGSGKRVAKSYNDSAGVAPLLEIEYTEGSGTPAAVSPVFTPAAGNYTDSVTVTLASSTPGATLYYTTDGSDPTTASTLYSGAFTLTSNATVKAIAVASGYNDSSISSASYTITPSGGSTTFSARIGAGKDDVEETAAGVIKRGSDDLEIVQDDTLQTIGLRFTNVTLPAGATITAAALQFTTDETHSDTTNLTIEGQATGNAPEFATINYEVSSRSRTAASVTWSPAPWNSLGEAGPDQRTTDLSAIVQEIVNRGDWSDGNSLAFIITGSGKRVANSWNKDANTAPLLEVTYTTGSGTPTASPLSFSPATGNYTDSVTVTLSSPTPGATLYYTTDGSDPTTSSTLYNGAFTLTADATVKAITVAAGYSDSGINSASYTITASGGGDTFSSRIPNGVDDVEETAAGAVKRGSDDLEMVQENTLQTIGLRYTNVTIPVGATITSATLKFTADEVNSETTNLVIEGEDTGSATEFVTADHNVSSRTRTSASINWSPPAWTVVGESGAGQQTPDLSAIVQEIIDRGDWSSGNSLAFIITGSGKRVAQSHNNSAATAPLLEITYSTAP